DVLVARLRDAAQDYLEAREEDGSPSEPALRDIGWNFGDIFAKAADQIERDAQDAKRYRWLRDHNFGEFEDELALGYTVPFKAKIGHGPKAHQIDAAIDAAMIAYQHEVDAAMGAADEG